MNSTMMKSNSSEKYVLEDGFLVRAIAHQAFAVISIRPLQTGYTAGVTGVIRMTRGGRYYCGEKQSNNESEGEWLYHITESSGKVLITQASS